MYALYNILWDNFKESNYIAFVLMAPLDTM